MDKFLHNTNEWLIRYIDGDLEGADKSELEKELETSPALKAELDNLLVAKESIRLFGLKQRVAGIHDEMISEMRNGQADVSKKAAVRRMIRYSLAVAAAILVLFVGVKTYDNYNLSADSLFKEQFTAYDLGSLRGSDATQYSAIELAYRNKDYKRVVLLSGKSDSAGIKEKFLTGISFLETGDLKKSIEKFTSVLELSKISSESIFKDAAEYYLSLSYLKNKDYSNALELMRSIAADPQHLYHSKITGSYIHQVERLK